MSKIVGEHKEWKRPCSAELLLPVGIFMKRWALKGLCGNINAAAKLACPVDISEGLRFGCDNYLAFIGPCLYWGLHAVDGHGNIALGGGDGGALINDELA